MPSLDLFKAGDVYLDYPFEDIKFRYDKATNRVFGRLYGKQECELQQSDRLFNEAISAGTVITREAYLADFGFTPAAAAEHLRRGDFTTVESLFGDLTRPQDPESAIMRWIDAGEFDASPDVLAEALTCACWLGQVGVATRLLDRGIDPAGGMGTGMNALHWAASRGQPAAVGLLIARGAPLETLNMYDGTALATAVWGLLHGPHNDQLGVIRVLIAAGADRSAIDVPTGHAGIDALIGQSIDSPSDVS